MLTVPTRHPCVRKLLPKDPRVENDGLYKSSWVEIQAPAITAFRLGLGLQPVGARAVLRAANLALQQQELPVACQGHGL